MSMVVIEKIAEFISKYVHDIRAEGPVIRMDLRHIEKGNSSKDGEVTSVNIPYNTYVDPDTSEVTYACPLDESEIADLARDITNAAFDDTEGLGGLNRYKVLLYRKHETRSLLRCTFRMVGEELESDVSGISEDADAKGLCAQLMRHNEVILRTAVMGANQTISLQSRTMARQGSQIEALLEDRRKNIELTEELNSRHHEREMETVIAANAEDRKDEFFKQIMLLAPALVNKVAGKKILPESISSGELALEQMLLGFTNEQMEYWEKGLGPTEMIALASIIESVHIKKESAQAKKDETIKQLPGPKAVKG